MKIFTKYHILIATLLWVAFSVAQNGNKNFIDQPYIEVTGTMEIEIIPNEIYLDIYLSEDSKKGKTRSVEAQENQLIAALKALGIDVDKNLFILDFSGYYKRKFLADSGVSKSKRYQLMVDSGKTLGKVYLALDNMEVTNVSITKTSHSDIENITREAKINALKMAKEKAEGYAKAINQTVGKAIFIQEQGNSNYRHLSGVANGIMLRGQSSAGYQNIDDLKLNTITVRESVLVKFILN
ncbi:MAG: SIMPL domain-containing protein [Aestuariibaculum sp.]